MSDEKHNINDELTQRADYLLSQPGANTHPLARLVDDLLTTLAAQHTRHELVARSRRAWIDAGTSGLGPSWNGTPDELRDGLMHQQAELQAKIDELREANSALCTQLLRSLGPK